MGSFNWQDEESGWDAAEQKQDPSPKTISIGRTRFAPRGLTVLFILFLFGLVGFAWWQVQSTETELDAAVMESWQIILDSEASGDGELLINQLSGRDLDWIQMQQMLLREDKLVHRGELLPTLNAAPASEDALQATVEFAPNLAEAVLTHPVVYSDPIGRQFVLNQDEIFRLGTDRWLLSPAEASYWGEQSSNESFSYSKRFAYISPERDADVVAQFIDIFEEKLDQTCLDGFIIACHQTDTPQVTLRFAPTLTDAILAADFQFNDRTFILPSPSLVGMPDSELAAELLAQAYADEFLEDYLLVLFQANDVESSQFLRTVTNYALQQSGGVSPLTIADFKVVAEELNDIEVAFNQNRVLGDGTNGFQQFMDIPVQTTFRIMMFYRMQTPKLSPQIILDQYLRVAEQPFFPEVLLSPNEWDDFKRFVELRAAIEN
ncbi:MAG: hypothetical protein AAF902_04610 [Chloroflexota bacterium]